MSRNVLDNYIYIYEHNVLTHLPLVAQCMQVGAKRVEGCFFVTCGYMGCWLEEDDDDACC